MFKSFQAECTRRNFLKKVCEVDVIDILVYCFKRVNRSAAVYYCSCTVIVCMKSLVFQVIMWDWGGAQCFGSGKQWCSSQDCSKTEGMFVLLQTQPITCFTIIYLSLTSWYGFEKCWVRMNSTPRPSYSE